jgi:hypothetical protein
VVGGARYKLNELLLSTAMGRPLMRTTQVSTATDAILAVGDEYSGQHVRIPVTVAPFAWRQASMRLMILETSSCGRRFGYVGRGLVRLQPQCGVRLPGPRISAYHAKLTQDADGAWWMEVVDFYVPSS